MRPFFVIIYGAVIAIILMDPFCVPDKVTFLLSFHDVSFIHFCLSLHIGHVEYRFLVMSFKPTLSCPVTILIIANRSHVFDTGLPVSYIRCI